MTSGGSDSIDTAIKLARRFWQVQGRNDKSIIISRRHAYHGMHAGGTSLAGITGNRQGYGALLADVTQVAWDSAEALAAQIDACGSERVAAFFVEPVIGAGGVFPPPAGYLESVEKVCRDRDVLLIVDEVITGYGRIGGFWFASTRFGLQPDIVTGAKGVTSGYAPLGTVMIAPRVAEPFWRPGAAPWRHGYTYSGHAMACAVAMANLDVIEREGLLAESARLEGSLTQAFAPLAEHALVSEVRCGTGAAVGIQLDPAVLAADASLPARAVIAARNHGVLTRALATGALQISPPFVTTDGDVAECSQAIRATLDDLAG
jgi:adenosylmethionine-8-amino-7-oxononanoate aminotransferase